MSAPLVVNTADGTVWTRRGALRGGEALYAMAGVSDCPELVMVTLAELAEHVIVGAADVLPVPVGDPPRLLAEDRATIAGLIGEAKRAVPALLVQLAQSVHDRLAHDHSTQREDWYCMNLTSWMGERMGPVLRRLLDAEARIAELEAERHSTNEALDDAVQALRAQQVPDVDRSADRLTRLLAPTQVLREDDEFGLHHAYRVGRDLPEPGGAK